MNRVTLNTTPGVRYLRLVAPIRTEALAGEVYYSLADCVAFVGAVSSYASLGIERVPVPERIKTRQGWYVSAEGLPDALPVARRFAERRESLLGQLAKPARPAGAAGTPGEGGQGQDAA